MTGRAARLAALHAAIGERILVLDGAMGTMIQDYGFTEMDYRGKPFADHDHDLSGNNDVLSLARPEEIKAIHAAFLDAGADIVGTNTFNATAISQADYGMEAFVHDLNFEAARLAREAADAAATPEKPRFVAGSLGPTNKTASISPDVNDPGFRAVSFDDMRDNYKAAAAPLIEGGVDLLLLETVFDTLNAKAAVFALQELFEESGAALPVMISGTITDLSGRTLTGQTTEAFWNALRHAKPFSIGLNCSLGAKEMRAYVAELSRAAETHICAYPNAGLPNAFGEYDETPAETAAHLQEWAEAGLVNIVGGCCGTTPEHIRAIAEAVAGLPPRALPERPTYMRLAGLEPFEVRP